MYYHIGIFMKKGSIVISTAFFSYIKILYGYLPIYGKLWCFPFPKGVMTDKKARELNVGGEVLAFVW